MRARSRAARWFTVVAAWAAVASGAVFADGCGTANCAETASCLEGDDGATVSRDGSIGTSLDASGADDVSTGSVDGPDASAADASAGGDGEPSTDAADALAPDSALVSDGARDADLFAEAASDGSTNPDVSRPDACAPTGGTENCTNGIDDDCNGSIDCADPGCQGLGFHCVPQWPGAGAWTAPVALYDMTVSGGPAPTPPGCAGFYGNDVLDGHSIPVAAPANCTCSCGLLQDGGCSAPYVTVWTIAGCSGTTYSAAISPDGGCTVVESAQDGINAGQIVDAGAPTGWCAPQLGTSVPPWNASANSAWAETGRVCAPSPRTYFAGTNGGCGAGLVCVEPAPATFGGGKTCLLSSGQVTCPPSYTTQFVYYDGGTDTRGCTNGCSCSAPAGTQCQTSVSLFSNGDCSGTARPIGGTCTNSTGGSIGSNNRVSAEAVATPSGAQCPPSAGATAPTGKVTASTGAVTVCCAP
jgi:hypothetical protein